MNDFVVRKVAGWGLALWLFGYVLGFMLYALVPAAQIGWWITPVGLAATVYVLATRAAPGTWREAWLLGVV